MTFSLDTLDDTDRFAPLAEYLITDYCISYGHKLSFLETDEKKLRLNHTPLFLCNIDIITNDDMYIADFIIATRQLLDEMKKRAITQFIRLIKDDDDTWYENDKVSIRLIDTVIQGHRVLRLACLVR